MSTATLNHENELVDTGKDSIVIMSYLDGVNGGRTLDTVDFTPKVIQAGHVVIKATDGTHKPMPVTTAGDAYDALPTGYSYVGVVVASVKTSDPRVGIMTRGKVNKEASPYPVTEAMVTAMKFIEFTQD
jgi:hypothetical protein